MSKALVNEDKDEAFIDPRFVEMYKNTTRVETTQKERRAAFLKKQKEKHNQYMDNGRDLKDLFDDFEEGNATGSQTMDVDVPRQKKKKFQLMMSEWFTEIPDDLKENWLVKFSPDGKRRLIIAQKHTTKCYNKRGTLLMEFQSYLPGGGKGKDSKDAITVLDCIYNYKVKTFFIVDMISWKTIPFIDCETQFRSFWAQSKKDEQPEIFNRVQDDGITFQIVEALPCDPDIITKQLNTQIMINNYHIPYDGMLFFHKELMYTEGSTPLVGWLKPYMLREKLGIRVPQFYIARMPQGYENMETYVTKQLEKEQEKEKSRQTKIRGKRDGEKKEKSAMEVDKPKRAEKRHHREKPVMEVDTPK